MGKATCKPYYEVYKQANSKEDLEPNKPMLSWLPSKKMVVLAKKGNETKIVHFGYVGMEDFTIHCDDNRRKNYLARSGGIVDKSGNLTKEDVFSANYWAREILW